MSWLPLNTGETPMIISWWYFSEPTPSHPSHPLHSLQNKLESARPDPEEQKGVNTYKIFTAILYLDSMKTEALCYLSGGCRSYQVLFIGINQNRDIDKLLLSQELLRQRCSILSYQLSTVQCLPAVPAGFHQTSWYQQSLSRISKCPCCQSSFSSRV